MAGHFTIEGSNVVTFRSHDIDRSLYLQLERPQGLCSSMQWLKTTSTSYFKYFVLLKFSKFCKKNKCFHVVDLLAGSCICTWNKLIKVKAVPPLSFSFKNSFLILKLNLKAANWVVLWKKLSLNLLEYSQENAHLGVSF